MDRLAIFRTVPDPGAVFQYAIVEQSNESPVLIAKSLGIPLWQLEWFMKGQIPASHYLADKLGAIDEWPASRWIALQLEYDEDQKRRSAKQ